MTIDSAAPRSRRAVIAAATGAFAALAAGALGRPLPSRATHAGYLELEHSNGTAAQTEVVNTGSSGAALRGRVDYLGVGGSGVGLDGWSNAHQGIGVRGAATVQTIPSQVKPTYGVYGVSLGTMGTGVYGRASNGSGSTMGVWGEAFSSAGTGVYGLSATGVRGETSLATDQGVGVRGVASTGTGVRGETVGGIGVRGVAVGGTAGLFRSTEGTALKVEGPVRFTTAGLATVASGAKSVKVTPGVSITSASKILCTLQNNAGAGVTVERVFRDTTANTFNIVLTANASAAVQVAWFVIR